MTATRKVKPSATDHIREELEQLRTQVAGVDGSLAATTDGLVIAHDLPDVEPSQVAALAAATLALASRATLATGCGTFREAVARGSDGYLAVYAAGSSAIVAVVGASGLNVGMLQYRARETIERVAAHSAQLGARPAPSRASSPRPSPPRPSPPRVTLPRALSPSPAPAAPSASPPRADAAPPASPPRTDAAPPASPPRADAPSPRSANRPAGLPKRRPPRS